jgi:branched-chain amino acid transport system substrate-binding protein
LLAILAACGPTGTSGSPGGSATQPASSTVIKIGSELPTSGGDASSGKPMEQAIQMAIDEANAKNTIPGYKLQLVPYDDVGPSGVHDPAVGAKNVTSLVGDYLVAGILGPLNSNVAKAEMPITNQAPIALISPANTNICLTKTDGPCSGKDNLVPTLRPTGQVTYFRTATTDDNQSKVGADYLFKTLKYKKVYVIDDQETYSIGLANAFIEYWKTLGGELLGHVSQKKTSSYVSLLSDRVAPTKPEAIYFAGNDSTGGTLIRQQMLQVPALKDTPLLGGDGIVTSDFANTIGTKGGVVYGTVASVDATKIPAAANFLKNFKAKYPTLGAYSAASYDVTNILIQGIKKAIDSGAKVPKSSADKDGGTTFRKAVIEALKTVSYDGVTGHHSFDQNGDTTNKTISIYKIDLVDGKPDWKFLDQQDLSASK